MANAEGERDWKLAQYHEALADIRWGKERASSVTNWSVFLSGGLVALARSVVLGWWLWVVAGVLALITSAWLWDLHQFAKTSRAWAKEVRRGEEKRPRLKIDPDHNGYLVAQLIIALGAIALAVAAARG